MEDNAILDLYFARDERAVVETDRKYGGYCMALAGAILPSREDAEETVSDTYYHTWKAVPPKRPDIFKLFLGKITRNLAFSRWRRETAAKRGGGEMDLVGEELSWCIPAPAAVEDRLNAKELAASIRRFLATLSQRDRNIFLRRYFYVEETAAIASRYDMRLPAVQKVLSRTRARLRTHLEQEGYSL